jgi:hypothetical protein
MMRMPPAAAAALWFCVMKWDQGVQKIKQTTVCMHGLRAVNTEK